LAAILGANPVVGPSSLMMLDLDLPEVGRQQTQDEPEATGKRQQQNERHFQPYQEQPNLDRLMILNDERAQHYQDADDQDETEMIFHGEWWLAFGNLLLALPGDRKTTNQSSSPANP